MRASGSVHASGEGGRVFSVFRATPACRPLARGWGGSGVAAYKSIALVDLHPLAVL